MKNKILGGALIALLSFSIAGMTQGFGATAQASGYHIVKTKSYETTTPAYHAKSVTKNAYMWNNNITKKLHNLKNYKYTTWYVHASYKMTNGKKTGIFYKVDNASGTKTGLVWRGYLTKGKNTRSVAAKLSTETASNQLISLFPGTNHDSSLQKIADTGSKISDGDYLANFQEELPTNNRSKLVLLATSTSNTSLLEKYQAGTMTFKSFAASTLTTQLANKGNTLSGYSGWNIATYVPSTFQKNGWTLVLLTPND